MDVKIDSSWKQQLQEEFEKPYFAQIVNFLKNSKAEGQIVYPKGAHIFNAFDLTPFHQVKIVLLGQDPYHGVNQAHGLSFSVLPGIKPPPSLVNIYKELADDVGMQIPTHGYLKYWAEQGVLMLNSSLTVQAGQPMSHSKIGWEQFTDAVIQKVSSSQQGVVFFLWGRFAQQKANLIDSEKHLILKAAHPSPFSAHQGFLGCKHFSQANTYLAQQGKTPIDWQLPLNVTA